MLSLCFPCTFPMLSLYFPFLFFFLCFFYSLSCFSTPLSFFFFLLLLPCPFLLSFENFVNPDVLIFARDGTIRLFNAKKGELLNKFDDHKGAITGLAILKLIVASSSTGGDPPPPPLPFLSPGCLSLLNHIHSRTDHTVKLWDLKTGQVKKTFTDHKDEVTCLTGADKILITGSRDHSVCFFDTDPGELVFRLEGHTGPVTAVILDGHTIASSSEYTPLFAPSHRFFD